MAVNAALPGGSRIYAAWREPNIYPAWREPSIDAAWREPSIYPAWRAQHLSRLGRTQHLSRLARTQVLSRLAQTPHLSRLAAHAGTAVAPKDTTRSAASSVSRRCATIILVIFRRRRLSLMTRSFATSRWLLASSKNRIFGSRYSARARTSRCFCPPESALPISPISVS